MCAFADDLTYSDELAGSLLSLSDCLGKDSTQKLVVPLMLNLLKDSEAIVRINVLKNLNMIAQNLGVENLIQLVLPSLNELAKDKDWRNRQ